jgi:hypothetical protein
MFSILVHNYSRNLDALRDFVETVSTVILRHRDDTRQNTGAVMAPYYLARHFDDVDTKLPPTAAEQLDEVVSKLRGLALTDEPLAQQIVSQLDLPLRVENGKIVFELRQGDATRILGQTRKMDKANDQVRILSDSALMTLVSIVEWASLNSFISISRNSQAQRGTPNHSSA